ncbi:hypothetical protein [Thioalkalivibrio sp. ALE19]|uniref:hypothetical protein n=1 Tax=Thioalkalivibrio sp. ALE19 TaxID=1266909 RepID=UPI0012DC3A2C|nr:hypothetical protein [Thioalkalivibrio sp. ALE19]
MPTEAKVTFDVNTRRAGYFLDLHESVHGGAQGAPRNPVRELPRAAVVFAVGALDSYLSDVSAEVIVALLQRELPEGEVREILKRVQAEVPTLSLELSLVPDPDERVGRVQEAVADHLHNRVSNHGKKAVSRTMERLGGSAQDLWSALGANGYRRAADDLDDWTEKRHQIVHQGQSVRVHRPQARSCVQLVEAIGERIDTQAMQALEG